MKMRNIFLSAMLGLSVCLTACKDEWDNHYSQEQGEATSVSELTLYDYLKSQPDYSRFMELMDETGGIIQGMSGSPILQDGKLIGAVTHVFVNDPTKGYGIFAETMLETVCDGQES